MTATTPNKETFGQLLAEGNSKFDSSSPQNETQTDANNNSTALVKHQQSLHALGGFVSKGASGAARRKTGAGESLMVRTKDSVMATKYSNTYTPAVPVEVVQAVSIVDVDAPKGYRQIIPESQTQQYLEARKKHFKEIMTRAKQQDIHREMRQKKGRRLEDNDNGTTTTVEGSGALDEEFSDITMPEEFPRDEFGVKIGFFPAGVRFIRNAIRACGGALPLEIIVQRLSTLADPDTREQFGDVRQFIDIHSPTTFRIDTEKDKIIIRLSENEKSGVDAIFEDSEGRQRFTWEEITCPLCSAKVKGRNLSRHYNCRRCVGVQVALGIKGRVTGSISALASCASTFLQQQQLVMKPIGANNGLDVLSSIEDGGERWDITSGAIFDDDDLANFEECLKAAGEVKRYKLSSTKAFSPILKAIRFIRARWLALHNKKEIKDIIIGPSDRGFVSLFATLGSLIHRLPIPWIETGDIIEMCRRFCPKVLQAFNPPPRPADPRIAMTNEYPGILFCDSEIDSEDQVSEDEDDAAHSDDEQEQFVFAPPVSVAESLMTAGFDRETRRLQYRLRTRPPMLMTKAIHADTQRSLQQTFKSV
eukprot:Tbor_TRINITY_DN2997_c0_g1::TRINITY_DN2997_c0_g1_i1::g.1187::m.1187